MEDVTSEDALVKKSMINTNQCQQWQQKSQSDENAPGLSRTVYHVSVNPPQSYWIPRRSKYVINCNEDSL